MRRERKARAWGTHRAFERYGEVGFLVAGVGIIEQEEVVCSWFALIFVWISCLI